MTFGEVKAATFFIQKEGFDLEAFFVPVAGFVGQGEIGNDSNSQYEKEGRGSQF